MITLPKTVPHLITEASSLLDPLEFEIALLVNNNANHPTLKTACLTIIEMVQYLIVPLEKEKPYVLATLRLALEAALPFVEEADQEQMDYLLMLYSIDFVEEVLPDPKTVPANLARKWHAARKLPTLDTLSNMARTKGLYLLRNDIPKRQRYTVIHGGQTYHFTYGKALTYIEEHVKPKK